MKILIFDEEKNFSYIENIITNFNEMENFNLFYTFYSKQNDLLEDIKNYSGIILIINSKDDENIFDFAKKINEKNKEIKIVFASKSPKFAIKGYKIEIYYYILLPISYSEFSYIIKKYKRKNNETVIINSNWQKIPIIIKDIHFIEKQGHNIIIHTTNKNFTTRTTFKKFIENFKNKKNFLSPIRGTIINFDWVDRIQMQNFIMKNDEKIPIRRKDRKKIKELFYLYKLKK